VVKNEVTPSAKVSQKVEPLLEESKVVAHNELPE